MKVTKSVLAVSLVIGSAVALSLPAIGQARGMIGMPEGMMPGFEAIDADKDGKVTPEEVSAFRNGMISGADANSDGMINLEELTAQEAKLMQTVAADHAARRMKSQDANGDGQLTAEELLMPPVPFDLFARLDTDNDGAVSKDEFAAMRAKLTDHGRGMGHGRGSDGTGDLGQE